MKRDLLLLTLCLCLAGAGAWMWGLSGSIPAAAPVRASRWTLILDAGHGGEDGGASSASGQLESQINLAIVRKTEALMVFLGIRPLLTREEDVSIHDSAARTLHEKKVSDLKNRVAMINGTDNALLISVHQNHFTDPRYSGAQTFYTPGDISRQWGEETQKLLRAILDPANDRKARPVPDSAYLFSHIDCPAILVECGFLSNGREASLLATDAYQRKIAVALAGAYFGEFQRIPTVWEPTLWEGE